MATHDKLPAKYLLALRRILLGAIGKMNIDDAIKFMSILSHNTRVDSPFREQNADFLVALRYIKSGPVKGVSFGRKQKRIVAAIERRWDEQVRAGVYYRNYYGIGNVPKPTAA